MKVPTTLDYTHVAYPEPHIGRTKEILKKHPEIRQLFGPNPWTTLLTVGIVALQFGAAIWVSAQPFWAVVLLAYTLGALCEHALFVVIHDAAHNLIFKKSLWSKLVGMFASLPGIVPSAIGFRNFHLLHHRFQGEFGWDADLAGPKEAAIVGTSPCKKILWLLFFPLIEGVIRPARLKKINLWEKFALMNLLATLGVAVLITTLYGWQALAYLVLSLFFSIGLHPLGGRWIQEHYIFKAGQETYSYYGALNLLALNVGYHNEHHDFMMVPWNRLPQIRRMAPEYYDTLYYHTSWTRVLWRFLFDRSMSLYSRVVRPDHDAQRRTKNTITSKETQRIIDTAWSETERLDAKDFGAVVPMDRSQPSPGHQRQDP